MAHFILNEYETVDERIQRFRRDNPKARIECELLSSAGDVGATRWVVKARVYRDEEGPVAGEGHAFEVDGDRGANRTSALENCETSAVGRALANAGYSGSRRTTREEMSKTLIPELKDRIAAAQSKDDTRKVWNDARTNGVLDQVMQLIFDRNEQLKAEDTSE